MFGGEWKATENYRKKVEEIFLRTAQSGEISSINNKSDNRCSKDY